MAELVGDSIEVVAYQIMRECLEVRGAGAAPLTEGYMLDLYGRCLKAVRGATEPALAAVVPLRT